MSRVFGVDFGTTTTAFVSIDTETDQYDNIANEEGSPFQSVVILDNITGEIAHRGLGAWKRRTQYKVDPEYTVVASVKRKLSSEDSWKGGNIYWTPEMLASEVLKNGTDVIKQQWPDVVLPIDAVMAVPVDFEYNERVKIINAAKKAGIIVKQLITEPTAAIVGCEEDLSNVRNALVFDWGGGTLDVSVLRLAYGRISELAKKGIRIGGDDLDELLARYYHSGHQQRLEDIPNFESINPREKDKILIASELNKRFLSDVTEREIYLDYLGGVLEDIIDRKTFEEIIVSQIEALLRITQEAVHEAKLSPLDIDMVLMVGGSSQIPLIKKKMGDIFGARCVFPQHADWIIARGAARLANETGNYTLSKSVGVVLSDNNFLPVIRRGEQIDHKGKSITLGLVEDAREGRLIIAESFADRIGLDEYKVIDFLNIPTIGYNFEPIEVSFKVQTDLALSISAIAKYREKESKKKVIYPHLKFEYRFR